MHSNPYTLQSSRWIGDFELIALAERVGKNAWVPRARVVKQLDRAGEKVFHVNMDATLLCASDHEAVAIAMECALHHLRTHTAARCSDVG